jgi:hypothetical protein
VHQMRICKLAPVPHLQLVDDAGVEELGRPAVVAPGARVVALDACGQAIEPQPRSLTVRSALLLADACASPLVYLASKLASCEGLIFVLVNMHADFRCKRVDEEVAAGSSTCAEALQPVPHAVNVRRALIAGYDIRNHGPAKQRCRLCCSPASMLWLLCRPALYALWADHMPAPAMHACCTDGLVVPAPRMTVQLTSRAS